ncbi:MAG: UDP-4-amino-4,6-dideoxy-N-acetyl-beta-L-altrosamine transaminase [Lachnospiraceae bacterium]|nr:UDP-4-amino-4,6-dideoxy-N-acetyl-beta-L-altrosamine transaminase [Lachnospiraceae bacterium]
MDGLLHYGKQNINENDINAVNEVLTSDFLTCGPKVDALEKKLCEYTGAKYATVVSNGTSALHCACIAAGIGPGDEVITTPLTFAASANCVLYCGGKPVFADVDPDTYNISPSSIEKCITNRTKAIIAVDYTGQVVDIGEIKRICDQYNLILIEDAAHSIGSSYKGQKVGSIADITTFSFHPVKTVTGGEGGAVLTNDEEFFKKVQLIRSHGMQHVSEYEEINDDEKGPWYNEMVLLGYNYRMTDFQAALILSQMERIDLFKQRRDDLVNKYNEAFSKIPEIIIQKEIKESDTCRHLYILRIDYSKLKCNRKEFYNEMKKKGILCQIHYIPTYWFPYYKSLGYERGLCPNAEKIYSEIMSIPLYPALTDDQIEYVIKCIQEIILVNR